MRPVDIDVVWVYGYGWPVYRGGPMWWADNVVGLEDHPRRAAAELPRRTRRPVRSRPPLLKKLVQDGKKFSSG